MARRSIAPSGSSVGAPCTWQRKPSSAYFSAREMPDLASRRLARTSWVLLPMDETMPIPVTTTRLMNASSASRCVERALLPPSTSARLHHFVAEQTDLEVHRPLDVDAVDHVLDRGQNLAGEF